MKILVAATGGTIGSAAHTAVISPDSTQTLRLLELYKARYVQDRNTFQTHTLCSLLSENADDAFYETLLSFFKTTDFSAFDGVILLHGTDTLSFTAPLLAMAMREFEKPCCLVSSNRILEDSAANGIENFRAAVRYIETGGRGFVVPYRSSDGKTYIHLATRILEADFFLDEFHSALDLPLAVCTQDEIQYTKSEKLPTLAQLAAPKPPLCRLAPKFRKTILLLRSVPNFDFDAVQPDSNQTAAILLTAYHSGTAAEKPLKAFAKRAEQAGIPLYLAPVKRSALQYASTDALLKANIRPLCAVTPETALAKLKLAYSLFPAAPHKILHENIYFEEV